eukprot:gene23946-biopygen10400
MLLHPPGAASAPGGRPPAPGVSESAAPGRKKTADAHRTRAAQWNVNERVRGRRHIPLRTLGRSVNAPFGWFLNKTMAAANALPTLHRSAARSLGSPHGPAATHDVHCATTSRHSPVPHLTLSQYVACTTFYCNFGNCPTGGRSGRRRGRPAVVWIGQAKLPTLSLHSAYLPPIYSVHSAYLQPTFSAPSAHLRRTFGAPKAGLRRRIAGVLTAVSVPGISPPVIFPRPRRWPPRWERSWRLTPGNANLVTRSHTHTHTTTSKHNSPFAG